MTPESLRLFLFLILFVLYLLALLSLLRRSLTGLQFSAWGLFALLVPALGPFLVILVHPGHRRQRSQITRSHPRRQIP